MFRIHTLPLAIAMPCLVAGQTVLYSENFEGAGWTFQLNTTDVGSTSGGANTWLVNNSYAGGNGDVICLGFPIPFTIGDTPAQPAGISPPNGNYLHTASVEAVTDGITCCSFAAADGFCTTPGNHFARMSSDINTIGSTDVTLSFWWLCNGGNTHYGEVYYSTNAGGTWNLISTPISQYRNQPTWVQQTITLPAFGNQSSLRFGFRFVNGTSLAGGQDPGFAIDDIQVTASGTQLNAINTLPVGSAAYCAGSSLQVTYTASGLYQPGNVFTAELSDANGSFATATVIGSVAATVPAPINALIPLGTATGAGYRIRVTSSAPAVIGTDNGANIAIAEGNNAGVGANITLCKNTGVYALFNYLGGTPDACGTWTAPNGVPTNGQFDTDLGPAGCYTYTADCAPGCPSVAADVCVTLLDAANAGLDVSPSTCSDQPSLPLFNFVSGGDLTGIFWLNGQPLVNAPTTPGSYPIQYVVYGTPPCENDTASVVLTVQQAPFAGSSTTATLSQGDPPVSLTSLLGGTPDPNGQWSDPFGVGIPAILDPATAVSGLYTYVVPGVPPCTASQATLAVIIAPVGIAEATSGIDRLILGPEGALNWTCAPCAGSTWWADVIDRAGRSVVSAAMPVSADGRMALGVQGVPAGVYVLRVANATGSWARTFVVPVH